MKRWKSHQSPQIVSISMTMALSLFNSKKRQARIPKGVTLWPLPLPSNKTSCQVSLQTWTELKCKAQASRQGRLLKLKQKTTKERAIVAWRQKPLSTTSTKWESQPRGTLTILKVLEVMKVSNMLIALKSRKRASSSPKAPTQSKSDGQSLIIGHNKHIIDCVAQIKSRLWSIGIEWLIDWLTD